MGLVVGLCVAFIGLTADRLITEWAAVRKRELGSVRRRPNRSSGPVMPQDVRRPRRRRTLRTSESPLGTHHASYEVDTVSPPTPVQSVWKRSPRGRSTRS